jgi:YhcH/YjgK/YiaL family protein
MIVDSIKNIDLYEFKNQNMTKAFEYIRNNRFTDELTGKIEIDGQDLYAIKSEYRPKLEHDLLWESHKRYIDIQYIIKGEELIGYTSINDFDIVKPYDSENDVVLGKVDGSYVKLKSGDFMVLFPDEAHKPGIMSSENSHVIKLVVKVKI